jgi:hypothetical protein
VSQDLRALVFSTRASDRRDGVLWLAALLRSGHIAASHVRLHVHHLSPSRKQGLI